MQMPAYKNFSEFPQTINGFAAWQQQCKEWAEYREWCSKRRFHARPEEKGIPVPGTGYSGMRKSRNGHGVSAGSRVLSHWYRDETWESKGETRRAVRRRESIMWREEWTEELTDTSDTYSAGEWFATSILDRIDAADYYNPNRWNAPDNGGESMGWLYEDEQYDDMCGDPYCPFCEPSLSWTMDDDF